MGRGAKATTNGAIQSSHSQSWIRLVPEPASSEDHLIKQHEAYKAVKKRGYMRISRIVAITPPEPSPEFGDADFSPEAIDKREEQGHAAALKALAAPPQDPCSAPNDDAN
jgi:hypothetical protein